MLRTKQLCAAVATGLVIVLAAGCSSQTADVPDVPIVPIVDVADLRSDTFQHAGNVLIRMSQSEWNEANVDVVEGVVPTAAGASLLIFEIPAPIGGEPVWFLRPNCPPCYDVVFTYYGWQCHATPDCDEPDLPPCAEIRLLKDRIVCFGTCPDEGTCEYRAIRLRRDFASLVMQDHSAELTAIWIAMRDPRSKPRELFAKAGVIGYYCGCN